MPSESYASYTLLGGGYPFQTGAYHFMSPISSCLSWIWMVRVVHIPDTTTKLLVKLSWTPRQCQCKSWHTAHRWWVAGFLGSWLVTGSTPYCHEQHSYILYENLTHCHAGSFLMTWGATPLPSISLALLLYGCTLHTYTLNNHPQISSLYAGGVDLFLILIKCGTS